VIKYVELTNPSPSRTICYWVKLEGHSDFSIESDRVKLDARGGTIKFPITFISRVSVPVKARIFFTNHNDGSQRAAALVFDLTSNITGRESK